LRRRTVAVGLRAAFDEAPAVAKEVFRRLFDVVDGVSAHGERRGVRSEFDESHVWGGSRRGDFSTLFSAMIALASIGASRTRNS